MKKLLWILLTLSLVAACTKPTVLAPPSPTATAQAPTEAVPAATTAPSADVEAEEYAVYSALISSLYNGEAVRLIVIRDHTELSPGSDDLNTRLESVQQSMQEVTPENIADFKAKNQQSYLLKPQLSLKVEYKLVSQEDLLAIINAPNGWDKFYELYPKSQGQLELSRVGFNPSMDKALVYSGNMAFPLSGAGYYYLLSKVNGEWVITNKVMVWIS